VTQIFHNTEKRQVVALYTFPVPKAASCLQLQMWINGKEMVVEFLERSRAKEIYESYKQQRREPGGGGGGGGGGWCGGGLLVTDGLSYIRQARFFLFVRMRIRKCRLLLPGLDYYHTRGLWLSAATATRKEWILGRRRSSRIGVLCEVGGADCRGGSSEHSFAGETFDQYWQAESESTEGNLSSDVVLLTHMRGRRRGWI